MYSKFRFSGVSESNGHAVLETLSSSIADFQVNGRSLIFSATSLHVPTTFVYRQFKTQLPKAIARIMPGSGRYHVLYTDYDHYCILWSCSEMAPVAHTGATLTQIQIFLTYSMFIKFQIKSGCSVESVKTSRWKSADKFTRHCANFNWIRID